MNMPSDRRWWPFPVNPNAQQQSTENIVKLDFLTEASRRGGSAFVQNNELECGATGDDGRECLIVWRGKHRAEAILMQTGELMEKRAFSSPVQGEAFNDAAAVALQWIKPR